MPQTTIWHSKQTSPKIVIKESAQKKPQQDSQQLQSVGQQDSSSRHGTNSFSLNNFPSDTTNHIFLECHRRRNGTCTAFYERPPQEGEGTRCV
ncbi:hypothetical protein DPMN_094954 [Dreissena polymorpha]|uniref:Uncharacterized protein n=1 Tax=Dreissena polymorpha TaxID=45954 RepID=A0A9D4L6Z8_DREPO|nr:hypothetical protein DPMN_094954 [Dreissena polymorpha]